MRSTIEGGDVGVAVQDSLVLPSAVEEPAQTQYTPIQILVIWASVALPMGFIYWGLLPILIPRLMANPGIVYLVLITSGMVWQGAIAGIILKREVKPFTWKHINPGGAPATI